MPINLLPEYRNQHEHRKYPFLDDASMTSVEGVPLPVDFLIDAFIYPIDVTSGIYVSSIDSGNRLLTISAVGSNNVVGTVVWDTDTDTAIVEDVSGFSRNIGILVFGPGRERVAGTLSFGANSLLFDPTCFIPLNQEGVRGIYTESSDLSVNEISFEGRNGVEITTYTSGGKNYIRIDIIGKIEQIDCLEDCNPIEQIVIENTDCPIVIGSHDGRGNLAITPYNWDASNLCSPQSLGPAPDVCEDEPEETEEWECPPDSVDLIPVVAANGHIEIYAPSTLAYDNPVVIKNERGTPVPLDLSKIYSLSDPSEIEKRLESILRYGVDPGGTIKIQYKGLLR